ncbi:hypothetical protein QEV83_00100 [Methylocapsa sp. D3K7]|uniref:hypothetical protein n=1 Tax=Methylocapsa sp. D3K7 TaxID=3041435 RepID=UPI00244E6413|nr:hypothetical protein [Methylocapsa sp. D3K7]WGJ14765.1 hypothetical protein QEV83_00100 [Methylocapsa sp. D3K7]
MGAEDELLGLIDAIYEAAFDSASWETALTRLADTMGMAQIGLLKLDRRVHTYDSIAPRTDPAMDAVFKKYWAFHNPLLPRTIGWPVGKIYLLDSLLPRDELLASSFFNEWMRPAKFGIGFMGANVMLGNQVSIVVSVANAPGNDDITSEQAHVFNSALPHINRAIRIHNELWMRDLDHNAAPERLEGLPRSVMLVDGAARLLYANAAARTLLESGRGLTISSGCLHGICGSASLQGLIASCAPKALSPNGPGGRIWICHGRQPSPLCVTVTPLRTKGTPRELPWLGTEVPAALVTVSDPASEKLMH